MVASSSEEPGGLDAEVPDPLLVVVHDAKAKLLEDSLILLLDFLHKGIKGSSKIWVSGLWEACI